MPFRNDYIMRLIEQLGVAIAQIIYRKGRGEYDEAEALISRAAQTLLGFDMALLRRLTDEGIAGLLRRPDPSDVGALFAAAELLREQGEIDEMRRGPDATRSDAGYDCNHKALSLYLECNLNAPEMWTDDQARKVALLIDRLRPYALPASLQRKLLAYHERRGAYAEAENIVHHLQEAGEPGAWEEGLAFYGRLTAKSDAALQAGGLPRDELEEGRLAFMELAAP